jgi:peptidoglycan-N-acetylglucosamine deacetylase
MRRLTVVLAALLVLAGTSCARHQPAAGWSAPPSGPPSAAPSAVPPPSSVPSRSPVPSRPPTIPSPTTRPPAPPGVPAALLGRDIEVIPTGQRIVALTFDAGANADGVASILNTLSAKGISATFFLTGDFARDFPGPVRAIAAAGHRIGNHTVTHPHCLTLSDAQLRTELATAADRLRAAGAGDPRPLFRFPFGERDARTIAVVNAAGYVPVRWTVDSLGWQGLNGRTPPQATRFVADRVVAAARPGEIVLMHVGSNPDDHSTLDAAALPDVVDRLHAAGYRFVTLDVLLSGV